MYSYHIKSVLSRQHTFKLNGRCFSVLPSFLFSRIFTTFYQRRQWHPTPVLFPGKSHGRRSLVGCSPWGREESDTTERLHFDFSLSCIGGGNGNPLQCSCLENPRGGVAQSRTRLKWLSSISSITFYTHFWMLPSASGFLNASCVLPWSHVPKNAAIRGRCRQKLRAGVIATKSIYDHRFDHYFPVEFLDRDLLNTSTSSSRAQKAVKRKGVPIDGLKFKCRGQRKPESSSWRWQSPWKRASGNLTLWTVSVTAVKTAIWWVWGWGGGFCSLDVFLSPVKDDELCFETVSGFGFSQKLSVLSNEIIGD